MPAFSRWIRATIVVSWALLVPSMAQAGAPFRTDDAGMLDPGGWELDVSSSGTRTSAGWSGVAPAAEANYGVAKGVQVHVVLPLGYVLPRHGRTGFGLGDAELGVKARLFEGGASGLPDVAAYPLVEVPIGNQALGLSTGHAQVFLPLWLQKTAGDWTVFGGGGYWINPGFGNKDYVFTGVGVLRKVTDALSLGTELYYQGASATGQRAATGGSLGLTYDVSDTIHLLGALGTGLTERSATNLLSYYLGVQFTF